MGCSCPLKELLGRMHTRGEPQRGNIASFLLEKMQSYHDLSEWFLSGADSHALQAGLTSETCAVHDEVHLQVALLPADSVGMKSTWPLEVISHKIPTLGDYSPRECWCWFAPRVLFKRPGVLVSLRWQTASSFL